MKVNVTPNAGLRGFDEASTRSTCGSSTHRLSHSPSPLKSARASYRETVLHIRSSRWWAPCICIPTGIRSSITYQSVMICLRSSSTLFHSHLPLCFFILYACKKCVDQLPPCHWLERWEACTSVASLDRASIVRGCSGVSGDDGVHAY